MKFKPTLSFISLLLFAQLEASPRLLLQANLCPTGQCFDPDGICADEVVCKADPCTINNGGCYDGQTCIPNYCGSCHAVCACPENKCLNPISHTCQDVARCFANPCRIDNGGCASHQICASNYCGGCNAVCEGDRCGTPGVDCAGLDCLCDSCPDGISNFGCCNSCTMEDDGIGGLQCSGYIPQDRVCPIHPIANCGGFDHCAIYFDGCNDCFCDENGIEACTEKACLTQGIPQCTECKSDYKLNDNNECIAKKTCVYSSECDRDNGFRCREDPMCGGTADYGSFCTPPPNVCVDKEQQCTTDEDCDTVNGFRCTGFNAGGRLICIKYE